VCSARPAPACAGALLVATNTMHKVAPAIEQAAGLPLLHIADATGAALRRAGIARAALLGTRFTMEDASILRDRLGARFDLDILLPPPAARDTVHRVIYEELCRGRFEPPARAAYLEILAELRDAGAQAAILGCTEIGLLIDDGPLPLFETTTLHAAAAVDWICS
jgi:aspartate racemase